MNFILENWLLILVAVVSGGMLLWPALMNRSGEGAVSTSEAVRLMNRERAVVIDVCEPAQYAAGHVAGARSVPLATLDASRELPTNKTLPLIVVCANGSRASRAAVALRKRGHQKTHVLSGGMAAWREANLPVESSKP